MADRRINLALDSDAQLNTLLAALALYQEHEQGNPYRRSDEIHAIATGEVEGAAEDISLDEDGIDELIELLEGARQ